MRRIHLRAIALILLSSLLACSTNKQPLEAKVPNDAWWQSAYTGSNSSASEKNLATVRQKMQKTVPFSFTIGVVDSQEINAYANLQNNQRYILFTNGFITQFGNDPDVLAAVMGHELAHHQLGHTQPNYGKNRDLVVNATSQALGMIASYFVPFSGLLVGNAAKGVGLSYSRDDERAADEMGMQWAMQAGFSPCGSYRFAAKMQPISGGVGLAFLSTHPRYSERMENAQNFAQEKRIASCDGDPLNQKLK